jgi:hypothetical protein
MIEKGKVDLSEGFEIKFIHCDCAFHFPGYSIEPVPAVKDLFRLVKLFWKA